MKTKLFLAVLAIVIITLISLQGANAQPWAIGGNTVTKDTTLGTRNSFALRLITNNSSRVTVTSSGDVGINTTTPSARLEVTRNSGLSNIAKFTNLYTGTTGDRSSLIDIQSGNGVRWRYGVGGSGNTLGVTSGQFYLTTSTATAAYLAIATNGNVGIGTTAPNKRLYVVSPGIYTEDNTTSGDGIIVRATGGGSSWGINVYSTNAYGIFASTGNSTSYAGYFSGNVFTTGTYQPSDRRFKQNIADLTSAMSVINKLQPKEYEYRHDGNLQLMNLPQGKHYGLIAQDVEQVLPNLVKETKFNTEKMAPAGTSTVAKGEVINYKALNYTELIPIMIKAMQELSQQNQELSAKNEDLQKQINELKGVNTAAQQSATKLLLSSASMGQNNPNPFAGTTVIRYSLPAGFRAAQVVITDNSGKTIKQVPLNTAGTGTVNIDASTLTSGTYNYSLVVDGKVMESKKMIVTH